MAEVPTAPAATGQDVEKVAASDMAREASQVPSIAVPVQADDPDLAGGLRVKPFLRPVKDVQIPAPAPLTTDQQTAYNSVLNAAAAWTHVPISAAKDAEQQPITEDEQQWLTRECLLRYLRATKWNVTDALARLQSTLGWRREYGLQGGKLTAEYISPENETGKQWIVGYDISGRPCLYLNPARQNTKFSERQNEHLVFMLERAIAILPPGQESLALLINFAETSRSQNVSMSQSRTVLSILQNHYPERLGRALLMNLPWFVSGFMKLITPFIDPLTRQKLVYNDDLKKHVPASQLLKSNGGDVEFEYRHEVYWPALNGLADERITYANERWIQGGRRVGELEAYLRGGQEESLASLVARTEKNEREKRPLAERLGSNRSGGLKVDRTNGDVQRPRKSVSIYEGREGDTIDKAPNLPDSPPRINADDRTTAGSAAA